MVVIKNLFLVHSRLLQEKENFWILMIISDSWTSLGLYAVL